MKHQISYEIASDPALRNFISLAAIPRCSGKEQAAADFLCNFAEKRGLPWRRDSEDNVLIFRPMDGSREPAALQAHIDMVCLGTAGQGVALHLRDGWLMGAESTLGGDNGIGAGYILSLLEDPEYQGPSLECLFTTNEEEGMSGAAALDFSALRSKRLINLDTEEEGVAYSSCAGGSILDLTWSSPLVSTPSAGSWAAVSLFGLQGGHSGIEIHLPRDNAILLSARLLQRLQSRVPDLWASHFQGGVKHNAIPSESGFIAGSAVLQEAIFQSILQEEIQYIQKVAREATLSVSTAKVPLPKGGCLTGEALAEFLDFLSRMPNGVAAMSQDLPELVETSSNAGILTWEEDALQLVISLRSSREDALAHLEQRFLDAAAGCPAELSFRSRYPAWPYRKASPLREAYFQAYHEVTGKQPRSAAIHAGLECGFFLKKNPMLDIISIGPDILDIHTCQERASLESIRNCYQTLKRLLHKL